MQVVGTDAVHKQMGVAAELLERGRQSVYLLWGEVHTLTADIQVLPAGGGTNKTITTTAAAC